MSTRGFRIALAAALTAAILLPAAPAHAAEPFEHIQREAIGGQPIDLDADGVRDLLLFEAGSPPHISWWSIERGRLVERASVELPTAGLDPVAGTLRVVRWHDAPRALVLLQARDPMTDLACCTVAFWIDPSDGRLEASPIDLSIPDGTDMWVPFDIDGDGTDELMGLPSAVPEDADRPARVLRFNGAALEPVGEPVSTSIENGWSPPADSDGLPGAEIIFGPDSAGEVLRVAAGSDGGLRVEAARLPLAGSPGDGWIVGSVGGRLLLQSGTGLSLVEWPAYGTPTVAASAEQLWAFMAPIAFPDGSSMVMAREASAEMALVVLDAQLRVLGRVAIPTSSADWRALTDRHPALNDVEPWFTAWGMVGPVKDGVGVLIDGSFIAVSAAGNPQVVARDLIGAVPLGAIGPADEWIVLARRRWGAFGEFEPLVPSAPLGDGVVIVPVAALADPALRPSLRLAGAARDMGGGRAVAPEAEVVVEVSAPVGSRVIGVLDGVVAFSEMTTARATSHVLAAPRGETPQEMRVMVAAITPLGSWSTVELQVDVLREPPALTATEDTVTANLAATVQGTTEPGARVEVGGVPTEVLADGSFSVRVDAAPWPRDVSIVATNPVGRQTTVVLSVVGLIDWRPISSQIAITLSLLVLGLVLYATAGRRRPAVTAPGAGMGTWEELDVGVSPGTLQDLARRASSRDGDPPR